MLEDGRHHGPVMIGEPWPVPTPAPRHRPGHHRAPLGPLGRQLPQRHAGFAAQQAVTAGSRDITARPAQSCCQDHQGVWAWCAPPHPGPQRQGMSLAHRARASYESQG